MRIDMIIALTVFVVGALLINTLGQAGNPYCDMRQVWEDTNGANGWPEYEAGKDERMGCKLNES